ncbi:MAG: PspA/IM30 family protein [Alkalispirochaeta sp.]|jgi:phage shock protein A
MGMFQRLRRLISSNVNDLVRKAEDPEKMLNQLVLDMNKQLMEAKRNVAAAITEEKRLERHVQEQRRHGDEWEQRAIVALRAGKEDLARQALERKQRETEYAKQLAGQYEKQHAAVEQLKASLRDLQDRIEEAQRKKSVLVARAKQAEAQKKIQEIIHGLGDTSAFEAFDRMSQRVEQLEIETDALAELDQGSSDKSLEDQIAALERPDGDTLLEDLRKKIGAGDTATVPDDEIDRSLEALKRSLQRETEDTADSGEAPSNTTPKG